jgi:hypothetical protein
MNTGATSPKSLSRTKFLSWRSGMNFSDLRVKRIETSADVLTVELMDGRTLAVPLAYYPTLLHATEAERKNCQPIGAGYGIEWPALDYHLSVEGLMQGQPEAPGLRRMKPGALTPA